MWWGWSKSGHLALDIIGLVPAFGEAADIANGIWYAAEGNYVEAGLSFASAIPLAGYAATAVKGAKYADEAIDAADVAVDTARTSDKAKDAAKAADEVVPPAAPKAATSPKPDPPAAPKDAPSGAKDTSPAKPESQANGGGSPGAGKNAGSKSAGADFKPTVKVHSPKGPWTVESRVSDGNALRDEAGEALRTGKTRTWTSAINIKTGDIAVGCSGRGKCAEGNILKQTGWDMKDVLFNRAAAYQRTPGGQEGVGGEGDLPKMLKYDS